MLGSYEKVPYNRFHLYSVVVDLVIMQLFHYALCTVPLILSSFLLTLLHFRPAQVKQENMY